MCGIAGISGYHQEKVLSGVRVMNKAQAHRGPDDEGVEIFKVSDSYSKATGRVSFFILTLGIFYFF